MANKYITNPCKMSGQLVPDETEIAHWRYPSVNTVRVVCEECNQFVSVNRKSNRYRKHSVGNPNWITVPNTGFVCGNSLRIEESIQNLVKRDEQLDYVQSFE